MIKFEKEELDAAEKYADDFELKTSVLHGMLCNAFLAGIEWQKNRYHAPDKEYYGG